MKNATSYLLVFPIIASCSAQQESTEEKNRSMASQHKINEQDSALQIDQYVVEAFEDSQGNLWFGTLNRGAARYDGKTLTYLSTNNGLCNNTVVSITEDKQGNMWFGTHDGVAKYDGKKFTNYRAKEGITGPGANLLIDKKGNLWAGTNAGAFRFNGTGFSQFTIPNPAIDSLSYKWVAGKIWGLFEDSQGNIWFARDGYGACKYDGKTFTHFTKKEGLYSNNVSAVREDKKGNIWFSCLSSDFPEQTQDGGLSMYDGKTFTHYRDKKGLFDNDIYTLYKDESGNMWIGATRVGAYRYDGENFTLFDETDRKDLTVNFGVQAILEDKKGNLWFGFSGGLFRFNGMSFTNITQNGPWK